MRFLGSPTPDPASGPDAPPATELLHSDSCLADFRRYGFCEHMFPALGPDAPHGHARELLGSGALLVNGVGTWWLMHLLGPADGLLVSGVLGGSWLMILLLGLPYWFARILGRIAPESYGPVRR